MIVLRLIFSWKIYVVVAMFKESTKDKVETTYSIRVELTLLSKLNNDIIIEIMIMDYNFFG